MILLRFVFSTFLFLLVASQIHAQEVFVTAETKGTENADVQIVIQRGNGDLELMKSQPGETTEDDWKSVKTWKNLPHDSLDRVVNVVLSSKGKMERVYLLRDRTQVEVMSFESAGKGKKKWQRQAMIDLPEIRFGDQVIKVNYSNFDGSAEVFIQRNNDDVELYENRGDGEWRRVKRFRNFPIEKGQFLLNMNYNRVTENLRVYVASHGVGTVEHGGKKYHELGKLRISERGKSGKWKPVNESKELPEIQMYPIKNPFYDMNENFFRSAARESANMKAEEIQELSKTAIREYRNRVPRSSMADRVDTLSYSTASEIRSMKYNHPVVGRQKHSFYDPEGGIGFCFGRATFAHLELLARGVNKRSIGKVWVVGSMNTGSMSWRYHVATTVRGEDGKVWVIDRFAPKVMDVEEWYKYILDNYSTDKKLRLHVTSAKRFGPGGGKYSWDNMRDPWSEKDTWYNGYFEDLMKWFRENHRPKKRIHSCRKLLMG